MNRPLGLLLVLVLATVVGCPKGERQVYANVRGTVTFNGKPLDKGLVIFEVAGRPPATIDVVDGKFAGQALVGSNKVSVSAKKRSGSAPALSKAAQTQMKGYKEKFKHEKGGPD